jgi:hypothetical protein
MLPIAMVLVAILGFSVAITPPARPTMIGPEVKTGDLKDYVASAAPEVKVTETPSPSVPEATSESAPTGMPKTFDLDETRYIFSGGPTEEDVVTTGEYTDGKLVYRKSDAQPPYDELYIEAAPNSGRFYRYVSAK